jgi:hypothetical protein
MVRCIETTIVLHSSSRNVSLLFFRRSTCLLLQQAGHLQIATTNKQCSFRPLSIAFIFLFISIIEHTVIIHNVYSKVNSIINICIDFNENNYRKGEVSMNPHNKKFSELLFQINNPGVVQQNTQVQQVEQHDVEQLEEDIFSFISDIVYENYVLSEDTVEPTEEDLYVLNLVIEYAIDNSQDPDIEEIVEQLVLDESIGSAIATAVHGIANKFRQNRLQSATNKQQKASDKLKRSENITKSANRPPAGGGILSRLAHKVRVGFHKARQGSYRKSAEKATAAHATAQAKADAGQKRQSDLSAKIDTGIDKAKSAVQSRVDQAKSAVKSKVDQAKSAIKSKMQSAKAKVGSAVEKGAEKVGNIAGRVVSKVAG